MELDNIMTIGGKPGLFKLLTRTRSGFVGQSLIDGRKLAVDMRSNVSLLSEISVYTYEEEVPLSNVLEKIKDKEQGNKTSVHHKDDKKDLESYFLEVLPNYDVDRVYTSDIKKIVQWYNILQENDLLTNGENGAAVEASSEEE